MKFKIVLISIAAIALCVLPSSKPQNRVSANFNNKYTFNAGTTAFIDSATLTSNTFVVVYQNNSDDNGGYAKIGTVSGTTVSYGPEQNFNATAATYISVAALSSSQFIVVYHDSAQSGYGVARVGTVSGTNITYGAKYTFNSADTVYNSVAALSPTSAVIAYRDGASGSNLGSNKIATISGDTITCGNVYLFNNASTSYISVSALSSSSFIVGYEDVGNSNKGTGRVGSVSGTIITFGSEVVFNAAESSFVSTIALSATKAIVTYRDVPNSASGTGQVATIAATAVSFGAKDVFYAAQTSILDGAPLTSTTFIFFFENSNYALQSVTGSYSGTDLTWTATHIVDTGGRDTGSICNLGLNSGNFVVTYRDQGNAYYGTSMFGQLPLFTYPDGTMIKASDSSAIYVIDTAEKDHIPNMAVLNSLYKVNDLLIVAPNELENYDTGSDAGFREGALIKGSGPAIYLYAGATKRHIPSVAIFNSLGYRWDSVLVTPDDYLTGIANGTDVAAGSHVSGTLIQAAGNPAVYVISGTKKQHIPNPPTFDSRYRWQDVATTSQSEIDSLPADTDVVYKGGTLVKSVDAPSIYVIYNGVKCHITSIEAFNALDYNVSQVRVTTAADLAGYTNGTDV